MQHYFGYTDCNLRRIARCDRSNVLIGGTAIAANNLAPAAVPNTLAAANQQE